MKLDSKITNIWFTADTHYWHTNICKGVSIWKEPEKNCRDFATVQEMSRHIVEKINECVKENDILEIEYFNRYIKAKIVTVPSGNVGKADASDLIEIMETKKIITNDEDLVREDSLEDL